METDRDPLRPTSLTPLWLLAVCGVAIHIPWLEGYGWLRDELYFVACSKRLAWGYVDFPPLTPWLAHMVAIVTGGNSLIPLRILAALAGGGTLFMTGLAARELGGGRFATLLAGLATLVPPTYLYLFHVFTLNAFDLLIWSACAWALAWIAKRNDPRGWLFFGGLVGLGLLNKYSLLMLGLATFIALLVGNLRHHLLTRWPWLGGLVTLAFLLPNLLWQKAWGWPTLRFAASAATQENGALSRLDFFTTQVQEMHPATLIVWGAGLLYALFAARGRQFRLLPMTFLFLLGLLSSQSSKAYYLAAAFPLLFAPGALAWERWTDPARRRFLRPALLATLVTAGAVTAPLALPILPVERLVAYQRALGVAPSSEEDKEVGSLPPHFADMLGWQEMAQEMVEVHRDLPSDEQARTVIFTGDYGEASALELFGAALHLPPVASGHNQYFLWGLPETQAGTPTTWITVGVPAIDLDRWFARVSLARVVHCSRCLPQAAELPVFVAREPKQPLPELWPSVRHFD